MSNKDFNKRFIPCLLSQPVGELKLHNGTFVGGTNARPGRGVEPGRTGARYVPTVNWSCFYTFADNEQNTVLDLNPNKLAKATPAPAVPIRTSVRQRPKAPTPTSPSSPSAFRKSGTRFSSSPVKAESVNRRSRPSSRTRSPPTPIRLSE